MGEEEVVFMYVAVCGGLETCGVKGFEWCYVMDEWIEGVWSKEGRSLYGGAVYERLTSESGSMFVCQ